MVVLGDAKVADGLGEGRLGFTGIGRIVPDHLVQHLLRPVGYRLTDRHVLEHPVLAEQPVRQLNHLYPGQVIKLSGTAAPAPAPAAPAPAAPSTSGTESVAQIKSMFTATAQSMGVDPALALTFGEQESSFRQNVTSSAGAIGVMQVIPSSGTWASQLLGRQLNLRNTQDDITAGITIIRQLVKTSPGLGIAIASYYQGQYSVMSRGMYDDTKVYVNQVKARVEKFR
ncbi:transglycosylase SLT domain-containing protein [Arthrobacter sp. MPF02]|uniref:transglycosylase SLT domain-containing protein n=1 Tax=Arthrobacter sp. MPF02 TaxID=3388492 RepID=UPI003984D442